MLTVEETNEEDMLTTAQIRYDRGVEKDRSSLRYIWRLSQLGTMITICFNYILLPEVSQVPGGE